ILPVIPQPETVPPPGELRKPGDNASDRVPITHGFGALEALLRQPLRLLYQLRQPGAGRLIVQMLLIALGCSVIYGIVVGTFSGGPQLWAAPVKIAGGLMISAAICLPSLYIFTCLSGSRARLTE